MIRPLLATAAVVAALHAGAPPAQAQSIVTSDSGRAAEILREASSRPHAVVGGSGALVYPRDSAITTSLIVLGRPTYLASTVLGDVIVVGSDLFLRPGADISGRAVAIGGTVALTTLGRVGGAVESLRDDRYAVSGSAGAGFTLTRLAAPADDTRPAMFQPAGMYGLQMPSYDRVDGLSLPVAGLVVIGDHAMEIEPSVTYRSRLGAFDPGVAVRVAPEKPLSFEGRLAKDTRTNDAWIYGNLVNSALSLLNGRDVRNYFRSRVGEGRIVGKLEGQTTTWMPYAGARVERVSPITAAGNVFSFTGRKSGEKGSRPNPLVEEGDIRSALAGTAMTYTSGAIAGRMSLGVEQSVSHPAGTSNFTQLTLDGRVEMPTISTQRLTFRGHAVATAGDSVPRARFAYLGGSGTVPVMEMLEQGGGQLVFLESRYFIPIERIVLPMVGSPLFSVRHIMGAAGPQSLPSLEQAIGVGLGISALHLDYTVDVAHHRGSELGLSISLGH